MAGQYAHLGAGWVILRQAGNLVKQLGAILVVEEFAGQLLYRFEKPFNGLLIAIFYFRLSFYLPLASPRVTYMFIFQFVEAIDFICHCHEQEHSAQVSEALACTRAFRLLSEK